MATGESFAIKLPQFEGPFDLLLFFIERDELDIHDVPISRITDEFLDYIHHLNALNVELASEFIFVAATLMRIKAKTLLPRPMQDEEGNEIDLKEELVQKLIEYKKFKLISEKLRVLEEERFKQEKRGNIEADMEQVIAGADNADELISLNFYKLMQVYDRICKRYQELDKPLVHTMIQYPYTIENQKKVIADLIGINEKLDFKKLLSHSENKVHFVYNFLALLEMLQQQLVIIQTGTGFNNFSVESKLVSNG
ncbi:segregation and condensation protein A [Daejeonella oryzae]|uniref:segregation and condensation protein A n=1 Tax=Daejeonella oryzae TaxID=1122943 RepID=UPI0004192143|nr:segregation/condensation protein A [Daejeonella oryzae]